MTKEFQRAIFRMVDGIRRKLREESVVKYQIVICQMM